MNWQVRLVLAFGLAWTLAGCSTSKDNPDKPAPDAGTMTAGSGGQGGAAGSDASGSSQEGEPCADDTDCSSGLSCVLSPLDSTTAVQICARHCNDDTECMDGETCHTGTSKPADAHCWNVVDEPFMPCGPADTSVCGGALTCILSQGGGPVPVGTCVNLCQLPDSQNPVNDPSVLATCPDPTTCVGVGDPDVGVCANEVNRGDACGLTNGEGKICKVEDICVTSRNADGSLGDATCYQDCTDTGMCDEGTTCMDIGGAKYCE